MVSRGDWEFTVEKKLSIVCCCVGCGGIVIGLVLSLSNVIKSSFWLVLSRIYGKLVLLFVLLLLLTGITSVVLKLIRSLFCLSSLSQIVSFLFLVCILAV